MSISRQGTVGAEGAWRGEESRRLASEAARKRVAIEMVALYEAALRRTARRYSLCADDADDAYQRALEIALTKAPNGTVKEAELEKEDGKLIWSFDIATPDSKDITEVLVDAKTGAIVSVDKETPEEQAKEKAEDAKKEKKEKDDDDKDEHK